MKTVLITGASDGIGKAIAQLLDEKGYELYLFGRSQVKMDALNINHCKGKYTFDLKDRTALQQALDDIVQQGGVNVLINNAGFNAKKAAVKDIAIEDLEDMYSVNTIAPLICIQKCIPAMLEKKDGMIINILSSCCLFSNPDNGGYTSSKDAFEALSKILVKEVKDAGIKVLDVYPGGVDTNFRTNDRPDYLKPETVAKHVIYALENNEDGMLQEIVVRPVVKFQLKSEQGWAFFMQKLQLNSGQELCTVNMIWNRSIKSSNFTVNKRKIAKETIFHIKSSNYTVDKTT